MAAIETSLPLVRPMLATLGELPTAPGWGFEFKWDGVRALSYVEAGRLQILSRNDRDVTAGYPELAAVADRLPGRRAVLDGEIVALDADGRPSFSLLQQRMHVRAPAAALLSRVPIRLYLFDVLHLDDHPTLDLPYTQRRALLDGLALDDALVTTPPWWAGADGAHLMEAAAEQGLEGVIAKRLDSPYQPGARSRWWTKTPLSTTIEVIICGWKPGEGRRAHLIGSLLLGAHDQTGRLHYIGNVGTGFTHQMLLDLARQLRPLHRTTPPFDEPVRGAPAREATWAEPELVGEVTYRTLTPDGRLRHPSWRGPRPDRNPDEVLLPKLH